MNWIYMEEEFYIFCDNSKIISFDYHYINKENKFDIYRSVEYKVVNKSFLFSEIGEIQLILGVYFVIINKEKNKIFYGLKNENKI